MTIEELKSKSAEISERVAYLAKFLKIADHQAQVRELEGVMTRPDFWDDKEKAGALRRKSFTPPMPIWKKRSTKWNF